MADFRAVTAVTEAVVNLFRVSYQPDDFNTELEFRVFSSRDFANNSMQNGASLFPYRLYVNGANRLPPGRIGPAGERLKNRLPVEVHFLITLWGREASLQNTLAGWVMRVLEDQPTLPAGILNAVVPDCFGSDETVDITLAELRTEDLFRIWDVIGLNVYQLSIPYVARVLHIDSAVPKLADEGPEVQRRAFEMGILQ